MIDLLEQPLTRRTVLPELFRADVWDNPWRGQALAVVYPEGPKDPARRARGEFDFEQFLKDYASPATSAMSVYDLNDFDRETIRVDAEAVLLKSQFVIRNAEAAPRSIGKTTLKRWLVIWAVMCYGHGPFAIFFGSNGSKALENGDALKSEWRTNQALREDFPEVAKWADSFRHDSKLCRNYYAHCSWLDECIILPSGRVIECYGMDAKLPGTNIRGVRPWMLIFEDTETKDIAKSLVLRETLEERVFEEAMKMLDLNKPGIAFFVGTIYEPDSLTAKMTDHAIHPEWRGRRYAAVKKFPTDTAKWNEFEALAKGSAGDQLVLAEENDTFALLNLREKDFAQLEPERKRALRYYAANKFDMDAGAELLDNKRLLLSLHNCMYEKAVNPRGFWCGMQNAPPRADENSTQKQLQIEHLLARRVGPPHRVIPAWAQTILCTADVNAAKFHWEVNAFGLSGEWCLIDQGYVLTELAGDDYRMAESESVRTMMLKQAFPRAFDEIKSKTTGVYAREGTGEILNPSLYGVDCGGTNKNYAWIDDVIGYCRRPENDRRWRPLKGAKWTEAHLKKFINRHWGCEPKLNPGRRHDWDADYGKSRVAESLEIGPYGKDSDKLLPGVRIFHQSAPREYMRHLTAEYYLDAMPDDAAAQKEVKIGWNPLPGMPNHWFDSAAMAWTLFQIWKFERVNGRNVALPGGALQFGARNRGSDPSFS